MSERKPQSEDKYVVRFPNGMRDQIRAAAEANNRSMNAEIIARLERSFNEAAGIEGLMPPATSAKLTDAVERLEALIKQIVKSGGASG